MKCSLVKCLATDETLFFLLGVELQFWYINFTSSTSSWMGVIPGVPTEDDFPGRASGVNSHLNSCTSNSDVVVFKCTNPVGFGGVETKWLSRKGSIIGDAGSPWESPCEEFSPSGSSPNESSSLLRMELLSAVELLLVSLVSPISVRSVGADFVHMFVSLVVPHKSTFWKGAWISKIK